MSIFTTPIFNDCTYRREALTIFNDSTKTNETWDHLTIYAKNGDVLARSGRHHPESRIDMNFNGLIFVAYPLAKSRGESDIFITVASLKKMCDANEEKP